MAIFVDAQTDATDLASLVNDNGLFTTRYGDNPKKSWLYMQGEFDTLLAGFTTDGNNAIDDLNVFIDAAKVDIANDVTEVDNERISAVASIDNYLIAFDAYYQSAKGLLDDDVAAFTIDSDAALASFAQNSDDAFNQFDVTLEQYKESRGFNNKGTFAAGFTYELSNDVGIDASGNPWIYNGALPFTVTAGTTPTSPTYTQVVFGSAAQVSMNTSDTVQSFADSFALKIFQSPTDGLTEINTRTLLGSEVYEVRRVSGGTLATIYADKEGDNEIAQNGTGNVSGSDGTVEFYISDGYYYVEVGGVKSNFTVGAETSDFPAFAGVEGLVGFEDKIINIFAGVDSLTDGAGGNGGRFGDSYINFVENSLRKKYGDAGVGWVAFDNRSTTREGMSFGRSANMQYIRGFEDKTVSPVIYSLDLGGLHSDSSIIGDFGIMGFAGDLNRDWDSCKVFYLQQPSGATIEIKQDAGTPVTVDTSGALSLQSVTIQADKGKSSQVRFDVTVAGACTVFGCFFTNNVTSGVMVSRLAYGGFQTAWFAGLDSAFQTQWLSELNPTHYLFNGGRNDISVPYTAEEFRDNADTYMSRFPATTEKLIFSPHASSTDFNGVIDGYRAIMRKYAIDNGYGYIDNSKVLGTYENATDRGWMLDETHASAKGNELIAANALKYMGANLEPWLQPKSFGGADSGEGPVLEGELEPKTSTDLNQGVASTIMKINQLSGDAVVTALVTVRTGSGTGMIQSEHRFRLLGGAIAGSITSSETYRDGMTETYVITLQTGSESDFELVMTPDAGNANFLKACVTARYSVGSPVVTSGIQLFSVD